MATKLTRYRLKGTTDAAGDAVVTTNTVVRGMIKSIVCNLDALAAGADTVITTPDEVVSQTILNLTNVGADGVYYPRIGMQDNAGVALVYAAAGEIVPTEYSVFSRLTATIAAGGATNAFVIDVYVEEY